MLRRYGPLLLLPPAWCQCARLPPRPAAPKEPPPVKSKKWAEVQMQSNVDSAISKVSNGEGSVGRRTRVNVVKPLE
jgi:hypothetical protein